MPKLAVNEIQATDDERPMLRAVRSCLHAQGTASVRVGTADDVVELPRSLLRVLITAADLLEEGDSVALVAKEAEASPAEAAKLLGVSRQYVDRLIADGVFPVRRLPGSTYRRIPVRLVLAEKERRDQIRFGVRRIVSKAEEAGLDY